MLEGLLSRNIKQDKGDEMGGLTLGCLGAPECKPKTQSDAKTHGCRTDPSAGSVMANSQGQCFWLILGKAENQVRLQQGDR